jgi:hypothetical protein
MKPGSRRDIQDALNAPLLQNPDKKVSFTRGSSFPIDQVIPFLYKTMDILLFVQIRFSFGDRIISIGLFLDHGRTSWWAAALLFS